MTEPNLPAGNYWVLSEYVSCWFVATYEPTQGWLIEGSEKFCAFEEAGIEVVGPKISRHMMIPEEDFLWKSDYYHGYMDQVEGEKAEAIINQVHAWDREEAERKARLKKAKEPVEDLL